MRSNSWLISIWWHIFYLWECMYYFCVKFTMMPNVPNDSLFLLYCRDYIQVARDLLISPWTDLALCRFTVILALSLGCWCVPAQRDVFIIVDSRFYARFDNDLYISRLACLLTTGCRSNIIHNNSLPTSLLLHSRPQHLQITSFYRFIYSSSTYCRTTATGFAIPISSDVRIDERNSSRLFIR